MKKLIALLLALCMAMALLGGCQEEEASSGKKKQSSSQKEKESQEDEETEEEETEEETKKKKKETVAEDGEDEEDGEAEPQDTVLEDVRFVMIYNPNIYEESKLFGSDELRTGNISSQVSLNMNRATETEEEPEYVPMSQLDLELDEELPITINKGYTFSKTYKKGDTKDFYYNIPGVNRSIATFECAYAGDYCNVWTVDGSLSKSDAKTYGRIFDEDIYEQVTELFGEPRFQDNGTKVNLLFYPMINNYCGFFYPADNYSGSELDRTTIEKYGLNTDHAIININSDMTASRNAEVQICGTIAHEFQHLIFSAATLESSGTGDTWINESMSGYIEEALYEGSKEACGHFYALSTSDQVRNGQSLYNFNTDWDIGVYGSVYLYATYLAELAGEDVFGQIHDYWREDSGEDEAEALYNAIPKSVRKTVDQNIRYPASLEFESDCAEFMSKLTLQFYLDLLEQGKDTPDSFSEIDPLDLVYDTRDEAVIEGGGRIIIAVKNGTFEIPEDAEPGLVYVGLNEDFEPVTDIIVTG